VLGEVPPVDDEPPVVTEPPTPASPPVFSRPPVAFTPPVVELPPVGIAPPVGEPPPLPQSWLLLPAMLLETQTSLGGCPLQAASMPANTAAANLEIERVHKTDSDR